MTTKTVKVEITGDPSSFQRSMTVVSESAGKASTEATGHFDKATSKIGGLFKSLDSQLAGFGIPFTGALGTIGSKLEDLEGKGATFGQKMMSIAPEVGSAFAVAGAAIAVESIHLADEFENAQSRLKNALKNTGNNWDTYKGQIDAANLKLEGFGYTNTEAEGGLAKLVRATGDVGKSTRDLGIAADIAAGQHISLDAAVGILVKTEGGRYGGLSRTLGLSKETIASFHTTGEAVDFLSGKYKGSAAAAAETFQGKIKVLTAQLQDIGIKIGVVLIPIIEKLVTAVADVIGWFERHKAVTEALGTVLKIFYTVTLGALIFAVLWVRDNWRAAWTAVQSVFDDVWSAITGTLGYAWGWIQGALSSGWNFIMGIFYGGVSAIAGVWNGLWGGVTGVVEAAWNGVLGTVRSGINEVVGAINAFISAVNSISISIPEISLPFGLGSIGGGEVHFPHIPHVPGVAKGGTFTKGGLALVGEQGPELVALPTGAQVAPNSTLNSSLNNGGGTNIYVTVHGSVTSERDLVKAIHEGLLKRKRQTGDLRLI